MNLKLHLYESERRRLMHFRSPASPCAHILVIMLPRPPGLRTTLYVESHCLPAANVLRTISTRRSHRSFIFLLFISAHSDPALFQPLQIPPPSPAQRGSINPSDTARSAHFQKCQRPRSAGGVNGFWRTESAVPFLFFAWPSHRHRRFS